MKISLRVRLTLWYMLLLLATLSLFSCVIYISLSRTLHRQLDLALETEAQDQVSESRSDVPDATSHDNPPPGLMVAIFDRQAHLIHLNQAGAPYLQPPAPRLARRTVAQVRYRYCTVELRDGRGYAQVFCSEEPVEYSLEKLLAVLLLGVPSITLAAGAGGLFLASRALQPIAEITETAASLSAQDLSRRLPQELRDDEIGRLTRTFNEMLARLDEAFQRQRQFTADAAHELRTPLALILGRAQLTLDRERTPEEYRVAVAEIEEGIERLSSMVAKLLTLARADSHTLHLELEELDLLTLSQDVAEALAPMAEAVRLTVEGTSSIVKGDQTRLTELLVNLVENALTATPNGGEVTLLVGAGQVRVRDTGRGIAREHLEQIFERFYQTDPSRSASSGAKVRGSCGLGLAICRSIARDHGATLTVKSEPGQGSEFTLAFEPPKLTFS